MLLIAELANPEWVSVPLEGWCLYDALSKIADVHLVTNVRNEVNIAKTGLARDRFTVLDARLVQGPLIWMADILRGSHDPGGPGQTLIATALLFSYYRFEQLLWRRFRKQIEAREFDLVHRLTPVSVAVPSMLASKCARAGVPFVVGPINGGLPWPKEFTKERFKEGEWLSYVRGMHKLMPGYASMRRNAAAIMAGSSNTLRQIDPEYREKSVYIPTNAVEPSRFDVPVTGSASLPLRVAFVGRMVPCKMPGILLEAAAPLLKEGKLKLDFYGDGDELPALKRQATDSGLDGLVSFAGWVQHRELKERLSRTDIFGFPSIRDFGGGVVLEAMAMGLVPIVVDYGGPGDLVSPATGFAIPIGPAEQIVRGFRDALERLVADPGSIRPMGRRARERVMQNFTWDAKAQQVREVYRWVLGERDKPDFGVPLPDRAVTPDSGLT